MSHEYDHLTRCDAHNYDGFGYPPATPGAIAIEHGHTIMLDGGPGWTVRCCLCWTLYRRMQKAQDKLIEEHLEPA